MCALWLQAKTPVPHYSAVHGFILKLIKDIRVRIHVHFNNPWLERPVKADVYTELPVARIGLLHLNRDACAQTVQFSLQLRELVGRQMGREQLLHCGRFAAAVVIGYYFARMPQPANDPGSLPDALRAELHHHPDVETAPALLQQMDTFLNQIAPSADLLRQTFMKSFKRIEMAPRFLILVRIPLPFPRSARITPLP